MNVQLIPSAHMKEQLSLQNHPQGERLPRTEATVSILPTLSPSPLMDRGFIEMLTETIAERNRQGRLSLKEDEGPRLCMVIPVGEGKLNAEVIVDDILKAFSDNSVKGDDINTWIRQSWGYVRVVYKVNGTPTQLYNSTKTRGLVPLETKINLIGIKEYREGIIDPQKITLILNKPFTTEGAVVAISHLTEEVIKSFSTRLESSLIDKGIIGQIRSIGIDIFQADPQTLARIYLKSKEEGKLCSGRTLRRDSEITPKLLGCCVLPDTDNQDAVFQKEVTRLSENTYVVIISGGKDLHFGHGLLLELALMKARENNGSVILINNNTGDRSNQMVETLARQQEISFAEAAVTASRMKPEDLESIYQLRQPSSANNRVHGILPLDIYSPLTQRNRKVISLLWNDGVYCVDEHEILAQIGLEPLFQEKEGDCPSLTKGGMVVSKDTVLAKAGVPTVYGTIYLINCWLSQQCRKTTYVDSSPIITKTIEIIEKSNLDSSSKQSLGIGLIVGGEEASGTKGNAPKLASIISLLGSETTRKGLKKILVGEWLLVGKEGINLWIANEDAAIRIISEAAQATYQPQERREILFDLADHQVRKLILNARQKNEKALRILEVILTHPEMCQSFPQEVIDFFETHGFVEKRYDKDGYLYKTIVPEAHGIVFKILSGELKLIRNPFQLKCIL